MVKVHRTDGNYYGVSKERGYYHVNLYNQSDVEIDGFVFQFETEDAAYSAAQVAASAFTQGQRNTIESQRK